MSLADVKHMSKIERLQAMEVLWDSICEEDVPADSPHWHQGVLQERRQLIESGQASYITVDELKDRIKKR